MKTHRYKVIAAFVTGIGFGMFVAALSLAPSTSQTGDKFFMWAIAGAVLVLVGSAVGWAGRRQEVLAARAHNVTEMDA